MWRIFRKLFKNACIERLYGIAATAATEPIKQPSAASKTYPSDRPHNAIHAPRVPT
jgi:hypothetical protein